MNNNDTETAEYWKKKALESQQRIYININTDKDTSRQQLLEDIKAELQAIREENKPVKTYLTYTLTHSPEDTAEEILKKINEYSIYLSR